jgi:TRAP-type C4-dicarboxylate transport system permease small subunit
MPGSLKTVDSFYGYMAKHLCRPGPESVAEGNGLDQKSHSDAPRVGRLTRIVAGVGSAALLVAVATDALAVLGRHTGFAFLGAIEIFQMAALTATSAAIVLTTLSGRHASVHILTEHVSARPRRIILATGHLTSALAFAVLCAGSIWVATDLWPTHELTELLGIQVRLFRLLWIGASALVAGLFVVRFVRELRA